MIFGISTATFTLVHVAISLLGILAGFVVLAAMISDRWTRGWNGLFLVTTIATSVTGFMFHSAFGPPHVIGVISLVVLAVALFALYAGALQGWWRLVYVVTAALALYLNFFVGVVQAFQKIPALQSMAPTQSEPPFLIAQTAVMIAFIVLGYLGVRRFRSVQP
jgi:magnesium-transporting ATPase (P-type)